MPCIRLLLAAVLSLAVASPTPVRHNNPSDTKDFSQQLQSIPLHSLNAALLNTLSPKYRSGVFEHPIEALNAVHQSNPILASRVIEIAAQENQVDPLNDLPKRQNDNNSTSTTSGISIISSTSSLISTSALESPSSSSAGSSSPSQGQSSITSSQIPMQTTRVVTRDSSSTAPFDEASEPPLSVPNTETGILVPITITTTDGAGNTQVQTNSAFQPSASVSIEQPFTTTNDQGQVSTATSTVPAAIFTGTNSDGQAVTTTSPVQTVRVVDGSIVETGRLSTSTQQGGSVVVVTYTPPPVSVSQIVYRTTVLPNGQASTVTEFEVVGAEPTTSTIGRPGQTAGGPQLASDGAAAPTHRRIAEVAVLVGGALGLAAVL